MKIGRGGSTARGGLRDFVTENPTISAMMAVTGAATAAGAFVPGTSAAATIGNAAVGGGTQGLLQSLTTDQNPLESFVEGGLAGGLAGGLQASAGWLANQAGTTISGLPTSGLPEGAISYAGELGEQTPSIFGGATIPQVQAAQDALRDAVDNYDSRIGAVDVVGPDGLPTVLHTGDKAGGGSSGGGGGSSNAAPKPSSSVPSGDTSNTPNSREEIPEGDESSILGRQMHEAIERATGPLRGSLIEEYENYTGEEYDPNNPPGTTRDNTRQDPEYGNERATEEEPPTDDLPEGYEWVLRNGDWVLKAPTQDAQDELSKAIYSEHYGTGDDPFGDTTAGDGMGDGMGDGSGSGSGSGSGNGDGLGFGGHVGVISGIGSGSGRGSGSGSGDGDGDGEGDGETPQATELVQAMIAGGGADDRLAMVGIPDVKRIDTRPLIWDMLKG